MRVQGSWDEAGWVAEPDPQGPYILIRVNLSSEAVEPLRALQRDWMIESPLAQLSPEPWCRGGLEGWAWRERVRRASDQCRQE